ncbi:MAG: glutaminyl-tRNA synthase (glutamine-hydrolyzing) subunit A [Candidatus Zambryskibacteria bacterium RIFCSPLOWO2_02_FULL_39_26]|uniref:Glutamyl-tRNA(Gln) amidotransferase subunit A n=1 Tax=Candidatus Zambryskibacteria bacterium RIFCSPLOWO2_12_FULL_39_23 TaxID=1802776 RepID=A0A1G2UUF4_9BACT|nr:MAG: glutaminyl-tRNA synthase (glutamine-hydrolyzing) subunit A [Candidatus Zambryskibacteria bacterium RIFCSPHIGHO2_02_39_10]OHB09994.1 MAG: glutaminyl-tRNA synthase (glutamine-hydrolyzing) subunit A [Candidatus Zambryskibacteria bacterium RIFCSPLOWO2_02_FULL_39_26]OHB13025.1 MAG: glutaminyl-tRNA synthase (glutamine-hydrolyzing) subunit A [Candidatus Zambryskibacteria bacterium RIFCSPLOWO2_12_FULL_39_23]
MDISTLTIFSARKKLDSKEFSVVELVKTYLDEINRKNKDINAYLEIYNDVLEQAKMADQAITRGEIFPMTGIPIAVKDNILIEGKTATSGSKILKGFVAPYDATVIKKLKSQHAVFLGRANMDEFAMGSSTENSAFGVTKNPLDPTRVAGGSSGGSVASVAMGGALASLGSDTGGSVREPTSFCGLVGLKPTYGGVSRYGLMALGSSLDVIGPVTKTVTDSEILWDAIKGQDKMDSTTYSEDVYPKNKNSKNKSLTIGVPYHILEKGLRGDVRKNFDESIEKLKKLGYKIKDIKLPNIGYSLAVYYIIMPAEASSNLARFDGVKYGLHIDGNDLLSDYLKTRGMGFGEEVRRRILIGTYVLSTGYYEAYYNKAIHLRQTISNDFQKAFTEVNAIALPTTTGPAFKIGEKASDPLALYLEDVFTVPANIVGVPAISIPSGSVNDGGVDLPLGIQFMAPHNCEELLFEIGKKFLGE